MGLLHSFDNSTNIYVERYLQYLYYVGILPFKPISEFNTVILKKNRFQQTFCILNYIGALIWTTLEIISTYPRESVFASPPIVLSLVSQLLQYGYILIFIQKFWMREDLLKRLLRRRDYWNHSKLAVGKRQYIPLLLSQCMPVFIVSLAVCSQWSLWQLDYFYPFIVPFERLNFPPSCCNEGDIFLTLVKAVLMVQGELMYCAAWYFVFIITVTGYRVTKQGVENSNIDNKISPGITGKYNMGSLFHTVHYLQQYFKDLNSVGCESYLAVYCAVIPWASFRLMTTLPGVAVTGGNGLLVRKFFYWIVFLYNATFLCLAAEAKRTVEQFRDNVISRIIENDIGHLTAVHTSQTRCLTWIKYVKHQLKDVCFHGGPFFNISYAFLGTTIGIVITFTLFQLQFGKSTEGFSLEV